AVVDLGSVQRAVRLNFTFDDVFGPEVWEMGATVRVRASDSDPWQTVYDTTRPTGTFSVDLSAAPRLIRYVQFVDKYGTYPTGTGYAGQAGTGTGRLAHVEVITASEAPHAPIPIKTVTIPADGNF